MTWVEWTFVAVGAIAVVSAVVAVTIRDRLARSAPEDERDRGAEVRAQQDAEGARARASTYSYSTRGGYPGGTPGGGGTV